MFGLKTFTVYLACVVCVMVNSSHGSEIIGGKEVTPHSLRYMAFLEASCGGTLIHPQWVLTAAHCTGIEKVFLGVHSIKNMDKNSVQVRRVVKAFPHPWYDDNVKENDLMLFKLNKPVQRTKTVQWLSLQKAVADPADGTSCMAAGWGETNENAAKPKMSDVLMSVNVTVVNRKDCNNRYSYRPITKNMVCAGSKGKKKTDTCQGDSGGPLICNGVQVGVTSFGGKCGDPKKPGVYAFLSKMQLKWIENVMNRSDA
ncbi:granzyme A-like [Salarias fasciatus]|uniref:Granzyme A-like n=1 Tax=Salarias fasciatus TaxID=181472 RepID=A0A672H5E3_SALFA|nr:granzyme A-like [Salarias fasciatus]